MMATLLLAAFGLLINPHVSATPVNNENAVNPIECIAADLVLHLLPSPTPFCSSYLSIHTSTIHTTTTTTLPTTTLTLTSVVATNTITPPAVTSTVISTVTSSTCSPAAASPVASSTSVCYATVTEAAAAAPAPATAHEKRAPLPTLPPALASFIPGQISNACSCLHIPTPSTTITATSTTQPSTTTTSLITDVTSLAAQTTILAATTTVITSVCPTPASCNNQGLQYAVYHNPYPSVSTTNTGDPYNAYDPTYVKGPNGANYLLTVGTTDHIGGINDYCDSASLSIYDSSGQTRCTFYSLEHRGYFFAPIAGSYTFTAIRPDDIAFFWSGATALQGWDRANEGFEAGLVQTASQTITLAQGQYLPIRVLYVNAQEGTRFDFAITDPQGTMIVDSQVSTGPVPYFVQFGCNGAEPPFPGDFGAEP